MNANNPIPSNADVPAFNTEGLQAAVQTVATALRAADSTWSNVTYNAGADLSSVISALTRIGA
jgi:hypothetical protein